MELPVRFRERMRGLLGDEEFARYEESLAGERMYGLRVNTGKITVEEFERISPFEVHKVPWIENGFFYDGGKESPAKHPYYHAGLYYLQEPSAMTPASLLPVKPGDCVLDLCAAPGGKATELGVNLKGQGLLVANDVSASRSKGLLKNIELFGISNVMVTNETPERLLEGFGCFFDKILIDAPCSGEGMFRKEPAVMRSWEKKGPEEFAALQKEIVDAAVRMLKPGGLLLYSTCTFAPEEDEGTVLYMLKQNPNLCVQNVERYEGFSEGRPEWLSEDCAPYEEQLKACVRIFPHRMQGEGHFAALLRKDGERLPGGQALSGNKVFRNEDFEAFLSVLDVDWDTQRFEVYQDRVYFMPFAPVPSLNIRLMRRGLLLGECRKNRFEPSQALAMALKMEQCRQVISLDVEDVRLMKYLKGETIEVEAGDIIGSCVDGWYLVCVGRYPLGWGKLKRQTLKNKYHTGWRWMS